MSTENPPIVASVSEPTVTNAVAPHDPSHARFVDDEGRCLRCGLDYAHQRLDKADRIFQAIGDRLDRLEHPAPHPQSEVKPQSGEDWQKRCNIRNHNEAGFTVWDVTNTHHLSKSGRWKADVEYEHALQGNFASEGEAVAALAKAPPPPDIAPKVEAPQPSTPGAVRCEHVFIGKPSMCGKCGEPEYKAEIAPTPPTPQPVEQVWEVWYPKGMGDGKWWAAQMFPFGDKDVVKLVADKCSGRDSLWRAEATRLRERVEELEAKNRSLRNDDNTMRQTIADLLGLGPVVKR